MPRKAPGVKKGPGIRQTFRASLMRNVTVVPSSLYLSECDLKYKILTVQLILLLPSSASP